MTDITIETTKPLSWEVPCFLIGLGAGVAMTLLFAPSSGASTRRLISRKVRASEDWVKDQAESLASTTDALKDRVGQAAQRVGLG
jgi:gas vesicle protein